MATAVPSEIRPALVEALLRPEVYGGARGGAVELRQTHISWLFFTADRVYKLKKPVDYGFLDFTTIERRRAACHEELRLNRRLSPSVYLNMHAVVADGEGVRLQPDDASAPIGKARDYVVEMRRLPDEGWLRRALSRGQVDSEVMRAIAARIADFHATAERGEEITAIGAWDTVRRNVEENFEQTRGAVGVTLDATTYDVVRAYARAFLHVHEPLFRERERAGSVCDGHGDLHLAQICLVDGAVEFIDCIEFNRRFRCADIAADLAFTVMDLEYFDRRDLSDALVDAYVARSGDSGLRALLPFYACYRAYTRGKVESLRRDQIAHETLLPARSLEPQASRYFELARGYARLPGPLLLITSGLMGSGKSTLARALEERLDAVRISSDRLRKQLVGLDPRQACEEPWGQGIYDADHTRETYDEMHARAGALLRTGGRVILDASYGRAEQRAAARELAREYGAPFLLLDVHCDEQERFERLARRAAEEGPSDGRVAIAHAQVRSFEPADESRPDRLPATSDRDEGVDVLTSIYRKLLAS